MRHPLAGVDGEDRQDPHDAAIVQGGVHDIHRPLVVWVHGRRQPDPSHRAAMPPRPTPAER